MKNLLPTTLFLFGLIFLNVDLKAQVEFYQDTSWGCAPFTVNFTNISDQAGMDTSQFYFVWDFQDDGIPDDTSYHSSYTYTQPGHFSPSLEVYFRSDWGDCCGRYGEQIQVAGVPDTFWTSVGTEGCLHDEVIFEIRDHVEYDWIKWEFGDGQISNWNHVFHKYETAGDYEVSMIMKAGMGCDIIDTAKQTITISETAVPLKPGIELPGGNQFCPGDIVKFNTDMAYQWDSLEWNFGDGNKSNEVSPEHSFAFGAKTITLTVWNGCDVSNSSQTNVSILNDIDANANFDYWGELCPRNQVEFNPHGNGVYYWDFGDGETSMLREPNHYYPDTGTYQVQLIVENNCNKSDTTYQDIKVQYDSNSWAPEARIRFGDIEGEISSLEVCPGEEVSFENETWGEGGVSYSWDFGDDSTSTERDATHSWQQDGTYQVMMVATNNCQASDTAFLEVDVSGDAIPDADLQVFFDSLCVGEKMLWIPDDRIVESGKYTFSLYYGDGNSDVGLTEYNDPDFPVFSYEYSGAGSYDYTVLATNICGNHDSLTGTANVTEDGLENPFYLVANSTVDFVDPRFQGIPDWSERNDPSDHEFIIPLNWVDWNQGLEETFYVLFTYDPEMWEGVEVHGMVKFTGPGIDTAYIPTTGQDSVNIFSVWYCNGVLTGSDVDAFGYLGKEKLVPGATTDIDFPGLVMMAEDHWDGTCEDQSGCPGDTIGFISAGGVSVEWHFGDGSAPSNDAWSSHVYADTGTYDAFVIFTNGCGDIDTIYSPVLIGDYNVPDEYINTDGDNFCVGDTISFNRDYEGFDPMNFDNEDWYWDFGDGTTSEDEFPLHVYQEPGSYLVTLSVTNGCGTYTTDREFYIDGPIINFMADDTEVLQGQTVNFINETQGAISYEWDFGNDSTSMQSDPTMEYVNFGSYDVSLTAVSASGCTFSKTQAGLIKVLNTPKVVDLIITDNDCHGENNGAIDITVSGGQPLYDYTWSTGIEDQDLENLSAGTYSLTIVDGAGTEVTESFEVTEPDELVLTLDSVNVTCEGDNDGSITTSVNGGTAPYDYSWSGGATTADLTNLEAGMYYLTLTDDNGCEVVDSIDVGLENAPLIIDLSSTDPTTCPNGNDGTASVSDVQNAKGTLEYLWDDPSASTTDNISGLTAGAYTVIVTDQATGCQGTESVNLSEQGGPSVSIDETSPITCKGDMDGELSANPTGAGYSYEWSTSPVQTNPVATGLGAGIYSVTVTDGSGCKGVGLYELQDPDTLTLELDIVKPSCPGAADGTVTSKAAGGDGSYTYLWNNGWDQPDNVNQIAGNYSLTVTDDRGCQVVGSIELTDPEAITVTETIYDVSIRDSADGAVSLIVQNGQPSYSFAWSNGTAKKDLEAVPAGTYQVTVTDAKDCSADFTGFTVAQPDLLDVDISTNKTLPMCMGETVILDAGAGFIDYQWSTGENTRTITVDTNLTYHVKVNSATSYGYDTLEVKVQYPFQGEEICVITVDTVTGRNMVVWEQTPDVGTDYYVLHRQGTSINDYDSIGFVNYGEVTSYIDSTGANDVEELFYKISVVDTCGNESAMSDYHKMILLKASTNSSGGINLDWEPYEVESGAFNFVSYELYRGTDSTGLGQIKTIASTNLSYIDKDTTLPENGYVYYRIAGILPAACDPTLGKKANSGPFSRSISNLEDNRLQGTVSVGYLVEETKLVAYPNPYNGYTNITYSLEQPGMVSLEIYNLLGQKVATLVDENQDAGIYRYRFGAGDHGFGAGTFYIRLKTADNTRMREIIEIE